MNTYYLDILSKISTIITGLGGLILAFYTLTVNRNLVFKNSLINKQIEELENIRALLLKMWFNLHYVKNYSWEIENLYKSLEKFEKESPEHFSMSEEYRKDSLSVFYKLYSKEYYLFPKWLDYAQMKDLYDMMQEFAPFTVNSLKNKSDEEINAYASKLLKKIEYIDKLLKSKS